MPARIEENTARVVTRTIYGVTFAEIALQEAIDDTLRRGLEIAQDNITMKVYGMPESETYQRTGTLFNSARASKFFATGGQVYLAKRAFKKRYYPRFVDEGTSKMEARNFWAPTTEALKAILEANMLIAAEKTKQILSGQT